ncbi:cation diffusion facilitator family transporter [Gimesia sp.]|uniref:cation diffusion facilitator family transporter n=1 Tax=Gimesia sp. TaxID=2024833 RepID=UPI000C45A158|nr:cation diffusion facilitator family transporter [Gimesia sp.]MAX37210.1 cation transporter [Gimesia sp.]
MAQATGYEHTGDSHAGHSHGLTHNDSLQGVSTARLICAILLNQLLTVGQVVAGIYSGSVALLSDAAHNFNDANALLIAYIARRISRKQANKRFTFGYRRAEMIGALINLTLLAIVGLYLVYEGITRFFEPEHVIGSVMAYSAILALVVDVGSALLLWPRSKGSLNIRAAFFHNIVDALASIAVLVGAGAILWLGWDWVDPLITLLISGYILWQVYKMLPQAMRMLMEGTPADIDVSALMERIEENEDVVEIHHLHLWELDEEHRALETHVVIRKENAEQMEVIKQQIKKLVADEFKIKHTTLEFEFDGDEKKQCHDTQVIAEH